MVLRMNSCSDRPIFGRLIMKKIFSNKPIILKITSTKWKSDSFQKLEILEVVHIIFAGLLHKHHNEYAIYVCKSLYCTAFITRSFNCMIDLLVWYDASFTHKKKFRDRLWMYTWIILILICQRVLKAYLHFGMIANAEIYLFL